MMNSFVNGDLITMYSVDDNGPSVHVQVYHRAIVDLLFALHITPLLTQLADQE
jgi:hypothetical protein